MGPKVEAAVQFLESGGKRAIYRLHRHIEKAVAGDAGTDILKDDRKECPRTLQQKYRVRLHSLPGTPYTAF